ncbi:MAG: hypothetical protein ACRD0Z_05100 [Acidimicrobiales bacterium]
MLECVVNVSEGRDSSILEDLANRVRGNLLDLHSDPTHNRAVFTLAGAAVEVAARLLARRCVEVLDVSRHSGVHPRLGVVDVVPFVPLSTDTDLSCAIGARDDFAKWFAGLGVPCFEYGVDLTLPEIRRRAWIDLLPAEGPSQPHPTAGACCVGARSYLVAYNLWLTNGRLSEARAVARRIRCEDLRSLGLGIDGQAQVSMNLVAPLDLGPATAYDLVAEQASIDHAELVGLIPAAVLAAVPRRRWAELGLSESSTIEARLAHLTR